MSESPSGSTVSQSTTGEPEVKKSVPHIVNYPRILAEAEANQLLIDRIESQAEIKSEQREIELRAIRRKYIDLEEELRREGADALSAVQAVKDQESKETTAEITRLSEPLQTVKRVLLFKRIQKNGDDAVGHVEVRAYHNKESLIIGSLSDTPTLVIDAVLAENGKPKNKYSLLVVGMATFGGMMESQKYGYSAPVDTKGRCNIRMSIRDFPTKGELYAWYEKHKAGILADYIKEHQEIEAEYREVVVKCNTPEWEKAYWKDRKDYYENHYSHGTEQPEYALVCMELSKLEGLKA